MWAAGGCGWWWAWEKVESGRRRWAVVLSVSCSFPDGIFIVLCAADAGCRAAAYLCRTVSCRGVCRPESCVCVWSCRSLFLCLCVVDHQERRRRAEAKRNERTGTERATRDQTWRPRPRPELQGSCEGGTRRSLLPVRLAPAVRVRVRAPWRHSTLNTNTDTDTSPAPAPPPAPASTRLPTSEQVPGVATCSVRDRDSRNPYAERCWPRYSTSAIPTGHARSPFTAARCAAPPSSGPVRCPRAGYRKAVQHQSRDAAGQKLERPVGKLAV